jgi:hypothetical protein
MGTMSGRTERSPLVGSRNGRPSPSPRQRESRRSFRAATAKIGCAPPNRSVRVIESGNQEYPGYTNHRPDNCGNLDKWQKPIEPTSWAKRSFTRKFSSAEVGSNLSVCPARFPVARVLMKCTAASPRISWSTPRFSRVESSENIPITPARSCQSMNFANP